MQIRKTMILRETVHSEAGVEADPPVTRVAGLAVLANPYTGQAVDDLSPLFQTGFDLGERLMAEMLPLLPRPAVSYGKAGIVGVNGDLEHAAALLHPMLGKAMRDPIGGGQAIIPSTTKVGAAGAMIDLPLAHKDEIWSFDYLDAITVGIPDGPRPDEIMIAIAIADGGRPRPRVGKGRAVT